MNRRIAVAVLMTLALVDCGCTTSAGIADFASQSQKAITLGAAILQDIQESCIRRHAADLPMTDFRNGPDTLQQKCAEFSDNQKGLLAASTVLEEYFGAVSQLASTGSATIGADAKNAAAAAGGIGRLSAPVANAVGELASLLARMAVEHYKHRELAADLIKANPHISTVTVNLATIVQQDYLDRLMAEERQALSRRYNSYLQDNPNPVVNVLLQERWINDQQRLSAKQFVAKAYIDALNQISQGHATLASHVNDPSVKNLLGLMEPYTGTLAALNSVMQKAY
jgi:hypothetical protein